MAEYGFWRGCEVLGGVIPLSPAWNSSYGMYRGRVYTTNDVKRYKANVAAIYGGSFPLEHPVWDLSHDWCFVVMSYGRRFKSRRSDSDSRLKLTKDAVFNAIGINDAIVRVDMTYVCGDASEDYSLVVTGAIDHYRAIADFFLDCIRLPVDNTGDAVQRIKSFLVGRVSHDNEVYSFG